MTNVHMELFENFVPCPKSYASKLCCLAWKQV